jgi:hypothetical protein
MVVLLQKYGIKSDLTTGNTMGVLSRTWPAATK